MSFILKLKLFHKFLLFVLFSLLVAIVMTSTVISRTNSRFFEGNISSNYRNIIKASAGEIRQYVQNARKDLEGLASVLSAAKVDLFRQEMALIGFRETATYFDHISLISPEGETVAATELLGRDPNDIHQDKTFERAASGQSAISEVMLTDQNVPYAHVAVPVRHFKKISAVIWGHLNLKSVWDVLEGIRIGETGQVYLVDLEGRAIGHREMDKVVRAIHMVSPEVLGKLLESPDLPVEWTDEANGVKSYCIGYVIPKMQWIIVLSQDLRETRSYIRQGMLWTVLLTLLLCMAAACAGWLAVKRILGPIHDLHRQVQRIGDGELDYRIEIKGRDEIGDLGIAVNGMAESLRAHIRREVENVRELAHARNLATLGTASSKVTHEVGNLLNNIEIILAKLRSEELSLSAEESVDMLDAEAGRVGRFIENMLQFAKKPHLRLQRLSLELVIQEIVAVYESEAEKRGARIELNWPSDLPEVLLDASLMYQVLNNLIKNALETTAAPSFIYIGGEIEADFLRVMVKDDGPGMEPDILDQIFEPFFSTKTKGTGVGLAICKTIVEAHRGTIECLSKPGEYTAFVIRLPLQHPKG